MLSENTSSITQPNKEKAAVTTGSQIGPQGDNEKPGVAVPSTKLQNVDSNIEGKEDAKSESNGAEADKTPAVGESFIMVDLTEKEEFVPMDAADDTASGKLKDKSDIDEEMKDMNGNSTELAHDSVVHHVQEQDVCQGNVLNESVTMESSADSSKDSGVIGDLSPQSPVGNMTHDRVLTQGMEGIEAGDATGHIPNIAGGSPDSAEAVGLVQQFESVTIKNQMSPLNANDENQIDSINTIDDDDASKSTESESGEGESSSDDSSLKPDENASEPNKGNDRKRKKTMRKKVYKAKRERKKEKHEMSKKGEINNGSVNASVVEKPSEKHTTVEGIRPHKLTEPIQEQSQATNVDAVVTQKDILMDISMDTPIDGKGENIGNQSVRRNIPIALESDGNKKVFGGFSENETSGKSYMSDYEVRGPPARSSLFELDKKQTTETDNENKGASPAKAAGCRRTQESTKTNGTEKSSGVTTRSMAKDKENKEKKQNLNAEVYYYQYTRCITNIHIQLNIYFQMKLAL